MMLMNLLAGIVIGMAIMWSLRRTDAEKNMDKLIEQNKKLHSSLKESHEVVTYWKMKYTELKKIFENVGAN
jgi:uncharacterized membrane-anchored protein YhcB (DUF1043 family)